jgi:hypothetical protein
VRDELPFLRQENEQLGLLLDNRDDMVREAKKMRKGLRASLEDARTRVAELETQNLDAKLEIDSLKASPVVPVASTTQVGQDHIATGVLLILGTNKQPPKPKLTNTHSGNLHGLLPDHPTLSQDLTMKLSS